MVGKKKEPAEAHGWRYLEKEDYVWAKYNNGYWPGWYENMDGDKATVQFVDKSILKCGVETLIPFTSPDQHADLTKDAKTRAKLEKDDTWKKCLNAAKKYLKKTKRPLMSGTVRAGDTIKYYEPGRAISNVYSLTQSQNSPPTPSDAGTRVRARTHKHTHVCAILYIHTQAVHIHIHTCQTLMHTHTHKHTYTHSTQNKGKLVRSSRCRSLQPSRNPKKRKPFRRKYWPPY